jgi:hypothetical protein
MQKTTFLIALLGLCLALPAAWSQKTDPNAWTTAKTRGHRQMGHSNVYLAAPADLPALSDLDGFGDDRLRFWLIQSPGSIELQLQYLLTTDLASKGIELLGADTTLRINGMRCGLLRAQGNGRGMQILAFGTEERTVHIMADYDLSVAGQTDRARAILRTAFWDADAPVDHLAYAPFILDPAGQYATFFDKTMAYIYTLPGPSDSSALMVVPLEGSLAPQIDKGNLEQQINMMMMGFIGKGMQLEMKKSGFISIKSGLRTYEAFCRTTIREKSGGLHLVLIEGKHHNYLFQLIQPTGYVDPDPVFYRLLDTFQEK